ncbi:MAG TPA: DUF1428 domain-containing protein [Planctomycetota bacterium]|nr:DUF1428 domain-containing protein [Planctomycetota bacterium]
MSYVDGYVIAVPKKNLRAYRKMAEWGKRVWMKYGAVSYFECVGDDLKVKKGCGVGFPRLAKIKKGETVVFSFIVYKSRKQRDAINAKVMKDPSMGNMASFTMPFEMNRFAMGGFKTIVQAGK